MITNVQPSARYDVVIAGGGIIGICTAIFLREHGLSVAVLDKGVPGFEQSGRNWGWVRTISQDMEELPLALASRPLWRKWAEAGRFGYRRCGLVSLAHDAAEWEALEKWLAEAQMRGFDARKLTPAAISTLLPQLRGSWVGALHSPGDGGAEPDQAMAFLIAEATRLGVDIRPGNAVRDIEIEGGRVTGVRTEHGRILADRVVVAAGVWSRWLCKTVGVTLPQLKVVASVLRTTPLPDGPDPIVASSRFSLRRRADGGYTVAQRNSSVSNMTPDSIRFARRFMPNYLKQRRLLTIRAGASFFREFALERRFGPGRTNPFEQYRAVEPEPDMSTLRHTFKRLRDDMPVFRNAEIAGAWAGVIDVVPDALPILSDVPDRPGLFVATGFSAHGFGIGPAAGQLMANLLVGVSDDLGRESFTLSRFGPAI